MNISKEELFKMYVSLRDRLDRLEGHQRGPITMREYRIACERSDKATMRRYLMQFKQSEPLKQREPPPGPIQTLQPPSTTNQEAKQ